MNKFESIENWTPCEDIIAQYKDSTYAVLILNTSMNFSLNQQYIINLWNQAKVRVTVDGGTKQWLQWLTDKQCELDKILNPDIITGDMDSISTDILDCFRNSHTKIIVTPDQDETDYTKALRELTKYCSKQNVLINTVYVLVDTSGRFDQIMANINTLYKSKNILENVKIYQIASSSLTWLLPAGYHSISIPINLRRNKEWCSLIPIGAPCIVTSTGLKWNLEDRKLEFGGLVSTSNTYDGSPVVTIHTDESVVWSMGIASLL